ncbi:hypothetical protein [Nocardiopsis oceani]
MHEDVNTYLPADMRVPGGAVILHHLLTPTAGFGEVAEYVASLTSLSCLVWAGLVVYALLDLNRLHEWMIFSESPTLLLPLTTAVPLTALTLAAAVTAWVRGWWGPVVRIHYSLLPLAAIAVIAVGATYGFVWSPG